MPDSSGPRWTRSAEIRSRTCRRSDDLPARPAIPHTPGDVRRWRRVDGRPPSSVSAAMIDCSVLVPVLNEERYIESSVTAMRRQRFPGELEFVFADGGSTDRTREILDELAHADPRVRVFANPGRSVSAGLNVCLSHARGRWALRMDAHTDYPDDYALLGVERLKRGGTRWVSGPQLPHGQGPVSRSVALALAVPLGRGGSRKWREPGDPGGDEFELDTGVFTGVWERKT